MSDTSPRLHCLTLASILAISLAHTAFAQAGATSKGGDFARRVDSVLASLGRPAAAVIEDVRTGTIIASVGSDARSDRESLQPTSAIRPLSAVKVFVAASWWEHEKRNARFDCGQTPESVEDILAFGCDGSGKRLALANFWQAIGNDGVSASTSRRPRRLMSRATASRLQRAMLRCVREGTAKSIAASMAGTGLSIGGKTGTGPGVDRPGSGGLFAGLLFDSTNRARYAIVVLVEGDGPGGGVAARTAAQIAHMVVGARSGQ